MNGALTYLWLTCSNAEAIFLVRRLDAGYINRLCRAGILIEFHSIIARVRIGSTSPILKV